ncbi:DNA-directed RNA polymerase II subunit RPB1, putative [Plasmodium malariae]|uniref:DNA-directed RNA polymerase subunit n=1 Tax=Plasmodium malariae TaxID=5858 RepID=A0A1A8VZ84_PLAMA|nr:DNA-directed RNA polymerase II subunit RPB1, putative [Plasmodium malariae]SBS84689.1 DNA-directed RNA polymerase II subunit RPB1, putative (RPB1) [Plasmodium malariae]SCN12254.1 DNA-directed RNA polymerase II subunit RPB1, putative [Plasmodium malariae]
MTVDLNIPYSACELKRVKRLELGVLDPEIIKKISVCEIVNVDIYKDGFPREGGLNDIRMGTIDYKTLCGTCNMNVKYCPGHFGYIELAKPMYHYGFMNVVLSILRCVCYHCGRLLCNMNNSKVKYIEKIKVNSLRLKKLSELCQGIKVCDHSSAQEDLLHINDNSINNFYNNDLSNLNVNQQMLLNPNCYSNIFEMVSKEDVDCGCVQPKYTREGPNLYIQFLHSSEEDIDESKRKLSAEEALEILKRIRKEEMGILGFNSDRCIPSSLILTYIPIPPPCARPYVQYGNQRSEDDLTLKLLDIVKTNIQLKKQTDRGAKSHVLQDLCSLLQFHITTLFDNDIPGMPIATTRSKKPIKAIKTRLKGKEGRLRGNIMGKRVDFSARTVITGDPNLNIDYIGVPKSVAMTLTFCETVTPLNYDDLKKLVERGPYEWPGARYIIRDNGTKYDLRHVRKNSERELEYGYKVERHMTDEDYILFNRQPSLHKMSIMGHKVKILPYSTFRLNLAVTSPYNADFDGDEMNLHLAQSHETRSEIKHLMIVQKQIVSPQGNKPVMGIVQDSLLAIRKFTRRDNFLSKEEIMSLLIWIPYWNHVIPTPAIIKPKPLWTGKQIFSMLLHFDDLDKHDNDGGNISGNSDDPLKSQGGDRNAHFDEETTHRTHHLSRLGVNHPSSPGIMVDGMNQGGNMLFMNSVKNQGTISNDKFNNSSNSNHNNAMSRKYNGIKINLIRDSSTSCKDDNPYCSVSDGKVIIKNNELLSGIICKRTVGSSSGSLIHILWHEMGPDKTKDFISALQKVMNNWLEYVGFTVSCSDIIASNKILDKVKDILNKSKKEVSKIVKKAQRGELECQPGKSLYESFETRVNNELNCAREMAGKVASESLDERNNIFSMVTSGSKGSIINISQIISCVGQQNVEGKRIPFGFNHRSLPHFIKFDYGPESRGFVSNSYLSGLTPQEVFFHAMGGREGIIDTACKTSETGYIQRRLIKAMEDVMVQYDRTVRNSYGDIIQFLYGEDGMAGEYIEDQIIDLMKLDNKEIKKLYKYNFDEEPYGKDFFLGKGGDDGKTSSSYIDYNKQNILNQEFEELYKCKNYLCKEIFPDGDIRQHLPINMNRLIEYAKSQFPFIPLISSKVKNGDDQKIRSKMSLDEREKKEKRRRRKRRKKKKKKEKEKEKEKNTKMCDNYGVNDVGMDDGISGSIGGSFGSGDFPDGTINNDELMSEIKKEYESHDLANVMKSQSAYKTFRPFGEEEGAGSGRDGSGDGSEGSSSEGSGIEDSSSDDNNGSDHGNNEYYFPGGGRTQGNVKPFGSMLRGHYEEDSSSNGMMVDPVQVVHKVNNFLEKLVIIKQINSNDTLSVEAQNNATLLLKAHLRTYLNSKLLTQTHNISLKGIDWLLQEIERIFYKSLCHPGECVGALAAQSIGEPATQMTLNTFHFAGVGSKNVTLGVPRLKELINIVKNVKTPSTTIYLDDIVSNDQQKAKDILTKLEYTTLKQLTSHAQIIYDPNTTSTILEEDKIWVNEFYEFPDEDDTQYSLGEWVLRIQLTNIHVNEKKLTMKEIVYIIYSVFSSDELDIIYTDDNSEDLILRIRVKYLNGEYNFLTDDGENANGYEEEEEEEEDYNNIANSFKTKKATPADTAINNNNALNQIKEEDAFSQNSSRSHRNVNNGGSTNNGSNNMHISNNNSNDVNNAADSNNNRGVNNEGEGKQIKKGRSGAGTSAASVVVTSDKGDSDDEDDDFLFGGNQTRAMDENHHSSNSKRNNNYNLENMKESMNQEDAYSKLSAKTAENDLQMKSSNKSGRSGGSGGSSSSSSTSTTSSSSNNGSGNNSSAMNNSGGLNNNSGMNNNGGMNNNSGNNPLLSKEDTEDTFLKKLMEQCLSSLKLRGIENITKVYMREEPKITYDSDKGKFIRSSHWVLDTDGCNLESIFCAPLVDFKKTVSNDIVEIFEVLGIEAVRRALLKELRTVISFDSSYVNYRHLSILCDVMTQKGYLMSITRHGINRVDKGPLVKCSFEETVEILLEAAAFAQVDNLRGITENIMLGQLCKIGTGVFDIIIDNEKLNDANQNLETIQDITSAGFTTPDSHHGITPDGLQSPIAINTLNSPLPFSPTYNANLLSPTAPIDNSTNSNNSMNSILSPQYIQNYTDNIISPTKNDFNNLDTLKLGGKFSPTIQSPKSPTSVIHSPFSPFDNNNQQLMDTNLLFSPKNNITNSSNNMMNNYNVFSPKANMATNIQSPVMYSPIPMTNPMINPMMDIFSPKPHIQNNVYSPSYSPTSPTYNANNAYYSPTSPNNNSSSGNYSSYNQSNDLTNANRKYSMISPVYSVTSPKYSPTSPQYSPTSPVPNNPSSPQYSPYSITSPKFSPTSPAYSISSPVYDKNTAINNNHPLSPAYILQSPVQVRQHAQDVQMFSPVQKANVADVQNDDPFSPMPYNIDEEEMKEE